MLHTQSIQYQRMDTVSNQRIDWEEYALRIAEVASMRSEDPYKKVGACALDENNRVIGVAYNGLASGVNVSESFGLLEMKDENI